MRPATPTSDAAALPDVAGIAYVTVVSPRSTLRLVTVAEADPRLNTELLAAVVSKTVHHVSRSNPEVAMPFTSSADDDAVIEVLWSCTDICVTVLTNDTADVPISVAPLVLNTIPDCPVAPQLNAASPLLDSVVPESDTTNDEPECVPVPESFTAGPLVLIVVPPCATIEKLLELLFSHTPGTDAPVAVSTELISVRLTELPTVSSTNTPTDPPLIVLPSTVNVKVFGFAILNTPSPLDVSSDADVIVAPSDVNDPCTWNIAKLVLVIVAPLMTNCEVPAPSS